ncbi:hypothetical protein ACW2Q0_13785 [Nocardia sp. R16R-3T]
MPAPDLSATPSAWTTSCRSGVNTLPHQKVLRDIELIDAKVAPQVR